MPDQHLAGILFFTATAVYMAFVARNHLRGERPRTVLAMALAWLAIILGLVWVADWLGWRLP